MRKKGSVVSRNPKTSAVLKDEELGWKDLPPVLLSSIFLKLSFRELLTTVPLVCKPWMEASMSLYCWQDIDIEPWCRRCNRSNEEVEDVVYKLIQRTDYTVQRFSAYNISETAFLSAIYSGRYLKSLEIPFSSNITDYFVLKHLRTLPNLRVLDISHCSKITAKGLEAFGNQCKSLVHLKRNLPPPKERFSPMDIDDSEAKAIADTMPNLQRIELCFSQFSNCGLSKILTKCKSLTHFDARGCLNVKLKGDLKEMCINLKFFQFHWTDHHYWDLHKLLWPYGVTNITESELFEEFEAGRNRNYLL